MKLGNLSLDLLCGFCVQISKWPPSLTLSLSLWMALAQRPRLQQSSLPLPAPTAELKAKLLEKIPPGV